MEQPRKPFLSFAGGASVGYITVHLLPEFQKAQNEFNSVLHIPKRFEEYSLYLVATVGFLTFYSINYLVKKSSRKNALASPPLFIAHIGVFVLYNSFIGYYLIKGLKQEPMSLLFFTGVFVLHIMVNDVGLRLDHKRRYDPWGSGVLALSVFSGWLIGFFTTLPTGVFAIWFGWLAGGILLNTIKEELPKERKSKLIPFLLGTIISSTLFFLI
ncbi:hypothetical protein J7E71_13145 [Mesobacillus foraminis]|uniref:hypothetical protein n=1 Tax=Mesobacillus foraminis TaxID=279826 RepID=UPI001BE54BA9|nr:hypothetical protein [Mesobacillus foraminis]MBT2756891.1 hypothetical protein [Mesobacillus foraminis]